MKINESILPYQENAVFLAVETFMKNQNFLLDAPMGSGKSAMMGWIGQLYCQQNPGSKFFYLTHRRNLFSQLQDDVEHWTKESLGVVSDKTFRGVDLSKNLVLGMVQATKNYLEKCPFEEIPVVDVVWIDEAHHFSESIKEGSEKEESFVQEDFDKDDQDYSVLLDSYGKIIEILRQKNPDLVVGGGTATSFRNNGQSLSHELDSANKHTILYEDVLETNRIVLPKTTVSSLAHVDFDVNSVSKSEQSDRLKSAIVDRRRKMGDSFFKKAAEEFYERSRLSNHKKVLMFFDSVDEIKTFSKIFSDFCSEMNLPQIKIEELYSGYDRREKNEKILSEFSNRPSSSFGQDEMSVLLTCRMVGEGLNVPDIDQVVIFNKLAARSWYIQMVGRSMRQSSESPKAFGDVLDFGVSSFAYGKVEDQIRYQYEDVSLSLAETSFEKASSVFSHWSRKLDDSGQDWLVLASERETYYARINSDKTFSIFLNEEEMFLKGRKSLKGQKNSNKTLSSFLPKASLKDLFDITQSVQKSSYGWSLSARFQKDPSFGNSYEKICSERFYRDSENLERFSRKDSFEKHSEETLFQQWPLHQSLRKLSQSFLRLSVEDDISLRERDLSLLRGLSFALDKHLMSLNSDKYSDNDKQKGLRNLLFMIEKRLTSYHDRQPVSFKETDFSKNILNFLKTVSDLQKQYRPVKTTKTKTTEHVL